MYDGLGDEKEKNEGKESDKAEEIKDKEQEFDYGKKKFYQVNRKFSLWVRNVFSKVELKERLYQSD